MKKQCLIVAILLRREREREKKKKSPSIKSRRLFKKSMLRRYLVAIEEGAKAERREVDQGQ